MERLKNGKLFSSGTKNEKKWKFINTDILTLCNNQGLIFYLFVDFN